MSACAEELILAGIIAAIETIDGTGQWNSDLRNTVVEEDTAVDVAVPTARPVVTVGFDGIDQGEALRAQELSIIVDARIERGYWTAIGVRPQTALMRIAGDIRAAVHAARLIDGNPLGRVRWAGTTRHRNDDGGKTLNGCTLRFSVLYSEPRILA